MAALLSTRQKKPETGLYKSKLVPISAIRRLARRIVASFHPEKIVLFGSYAHGTPTPDSDVDLLVVMPTRNEVEQAGRIGEVVPRDFGLDLFVRTPKNLARGLRQGDWFLREIVTRGRVLYEKVNGGLGPQG